ncbi:MAG: uracil-DNA glycosylase, partial [Actinomycetota bacterium]|nr:uracil-DNA glycosylase [Actinomycetota bacterium]
MGRVVGDSLQWVAQQVRGCTRCRLSGSRTHAVPGAGPPEAPLVLVGEGPGSAEDATGRPFQGAAGRFLDDVLAQLGVQRSRLFLTSMVKCRPPGNRTPRADELAACRGYLDRQLRLVTARAVLAMGATAAAQLHPSARRVAVRVG